MGLHLAAQPLSVPLLIGAGECCKYGSALLPALSFGQTIQDHLVADQETTLDDADALRATLEDLDKTVSTGKVEFAFRVLSRRLPLTARAYFTKHDHFTKKAAEDALAVCDFDAETRTIDLGPSDPGYANFALQLACIGGPPVSAIRTGILIAAIVPVRRAIRAEGGSFVGKEGAKLDALAAELNAPRFGKAGELLKELGIEVEWEFIQSRILGDTEEEQRLMAMLEEVVGEALEVAGP